MKVFIVNQLNIYFVVYMYMFLYFSIFSWLVFSSLCVYYFMYCISYHFNLINTRNNNNRLLSTNTNIYINCLLLTCIWFGCCCFKMTSNQLWCAYFKPGKRNRYYGIILTHRVTFFCLYSKNDTRSENRTILLCQNIIMWHKQLLYLWSRYICINTN